MATDDYKRALEAANREYEDLLEQRASLDVRIARLAQSIGSLTRLCGYIPAVKWGLTEACRMVLQSAGYALTPVEIRAQLEAMGLDMSRYTNDLAVIHTTLKRLTKSGEAKFVPRGYNEPGYQWERTAAASSSRRRASASFQNEKRAKTRRER
jgi:hypothetical protein